VRRISDCEFRISDFVSAIWDSDFETGS